MDSEITMINRNSSFAVLLTHDLTGVDWRELPFEGVLWCEDRHLFEQFSCDIDGNTENCEILDDGTLRVFISGSRLSLGNMEMELTIYTPDESYPSGIRKTTNKYHLPIVLTNDDVSLLSEVNVRVTLPFIYRSSYDLAVAHGYQGSYAEFVEAVVNLPALVENTQSITADANEAAANAIQSAINANAASQNANTAAQRAEEALNDLDATLEEAIRLKDEEFATLVTKDRLREIAKPYVQGQEYEQGTLISHNNVLYVVSATSTNTTPSPDNGNYTVLVDAAAVAVADEAKAAEDAADWERIDYMRTFHPDNGYYFQVAAGTTYEGVTYDRDTWIRRAAPVFYKFESLGANLLKVAQLPTFSGYASRMFASCSSLEDPKVFRDWDVSGLIGIAMMFYKCGFTEIDLSRWNTSSMTTPTSLFEGCAKLRKVDVSGWDLSHCTTLAQVFYDCPNLEEIVGLDTWDTSNITNFYAIFYNCSKLRYITLSPKFFKTTATIPFVMANNIGRDEGGSNNGWVQHLSAVAPIIRDKQGYTDLLEQENGLWYLNDGVGRTIQLPSALKNAGWASPMLNILRDHGYTIA